MPTSIFVALGLLVTTSVPSPTTPSAALAPHTRAAAAANAAPVPTSPPPAALAPHTQAVAAANATLYRQIAGQEPKNFVFSPWALQTAAGMLYAGAGGKTAQELRQAFSFAGDANAVGAAHAQVAAALKPDPKSPVVVRQATRQWIDQSFPVSPDYAAAMQQRYDADAVNLALSSHPSTAATQINQWVAERTQNLIPKLLDAGAISADTRLVQTAALYFKAPWTQPFIPDPNKRVFHGLHGTRPVEMMRRNPHGDSAKWCHFKSAELEAIEIPYQGGAYAMLLVMPKGDFKAFEEHIDAAQLTADQGGWDCGGVLLTLPPFHIETPLDVRKSLEALGAHALFSPSAELPGISKVPLQVSTLVEKAVITVDKNGTEAAAATAAAIAIRSAALRSPPELVIDRPFLFFIRDTQHHVALFSGRVTDL